MSMMGFAVVDGHRRTDARRWVVGIVFKLALSLFNVSVIEVLGLLKSMAIPSISILCFVIMPILRMKTYIVRFIILIWINN